jgi:uncharacterized protein YbjT (DUF2867 family)
VLFLLSRHTTTRISGYTRAMSPPTCFVTGGTGRIGTSFVHEMAARGFTVRVGTRDPDGADARLRKAFGPGRVEPVQMPVDDTDALARALEGCESGLLIASSFTDMTAWHTTMATAAAKAGVKHLVKVSVTGARAPGGDPPAGRIPSLHFAGEDAVRASGVPATMIRPTIFAQHFLGLSPALFREGDGQFHLPTGDAKIAFVDCRDIAICAAAILSDPDKRKAAAGRAFELTGPSAVTAADIATLLSLAGERTIAHVDGVDAFEKHAAAIGVGDGIKGIYGEAAGGWFGAVHDDEFVEFVGRHTTSFAKFAFDNQAAFTARS